MLERLSSWGGVIIGIIIGVIAANMPLDRFQIGTWWWACGLAGGWLGYKLMPPDINTFEWINLPSKEANHLEPANEAASLVDLDSSLY